MNSERTESLTALPVVALSGRKHVRRPGHPASEAGQAQGPAPMVRIIAVGY